MYNEEAGAEICVRNICAVLATEPARAGLVVVNDGSSDGTEKILQRLRPMFPVLTVVNHTSNRGYGAALRTGIAKAIEESFEYVLFMDSDLTNNPADIPRFTEKMQAGFDLIKATRYTGGGTVEGVPFRRVIISRVGNWLARRLFQLPVHDCTNGFRAVRTSLLEKLQLSEDRFSIILEELYWLKFLAHSYIEIPVILTNRAGGRRATSFAYSPAVFWTYLRWPLRAASGIRPEWRSR